MKKRVAVPLLALAVTGGYFALVQETPQEREARHLKRGNEYFAKGELQKARIEYKNAAKLMPLDPEVSYRWALVEEAEGNIRSAYANFIRAEQQDPHYAPALLRIAHYNLVVEQYDEVRKRIDTVLAKDPENAQAHALLGALHLRDKKFSEAEKEAKTALAKDPTNTTAYSVLTGMELANQNMEKAEAYLSEGIAKNPADISLLMLKVKIYENPLNIDKINEAYQAIFKLQPNDASLRLVLADIYTNAKRLDDAENALRTAVTDIPDNWMLKGRLIGFLSEFRAPEVAEKELENLMSQNPERGELYLWLAELYLKNGNVDKASEVLQQVVARDASDRQSLNARASLAHITFKRGDRELANKLLDAILEKSPTNAEARMVRASMLADEGRFQSSVTLLRQVIRDNPRAVEARQLLAEVLVLQGYPDLAIETLNQLIDIAPSNMAARVRLAQMYSQNNDPRRGIEILETSLKTDPTYPVAWESMARIAIAIKDDKTATKAIDQLRQFKGHEKVAEFLEGQMAQELGNHSSARSTYTKVIDADPNSALAEHAVFELVERYHTQEDLKQTVAYLSQLNTQSAYIKTILGECLQRVGQVAEAAQAFDQAIESSPNSQDAFLHRAKLYIEEKNYDKALTVLSAAIRAFEADPRASLLQASIWSRQGQFDNAVKIYEELLALNPELDVAANNLASIIAEHQHSDSERLQKAEKLAERFASSKNASFLDTLAWVYYRRGKPDQALSVITRAISENENASPELYYHYGMILLQNGNKPKAKEALLKATSEGASYSGLEVAKAELKKLQ